MIVATVTKTDPLMLVAEGTTTPVQPALIADSLGLSVGDRVLCVLVDQRLVIIEKIRVTNLPLDVSGVNSNGAWNRFGDLLICRFQLAVTANPTVWTFPHEFANNPTITTGVFNGNSRKATISARSTSTASVNVFSDAGAFPGSTFVFLTAYGTPA